ncbi:response regulator [Epidermidibacterium keratini]|uniref:Response regulator n=1 Tax=Epidermidibacterium keratini TaxID=1891644 RepID=A0A7L4YN47_9ACTN|nr:response regulator transcription factor [Epidermidibacterium keratini]QHC00274.1 response regulator [Epidermidibacterium keratini]
MISVLLVDDHPIVRAGLRALLAGSGEVEIAAEAANGEDAVRLVTEGGFDVVLMDLQLGAGIDGAEATRRIVELPRAPRVLILTTYDTDADIVRAIEAGAAGYLLKDTATDVLVAAVRDAAAGENVLDAPIAARLERRHESGLSPRELEVLSAVAGGLTNREIAAGLFLSEATVKSHLVHAFTKLDVDSRTAAVARARSLGLIR